MRTLLFRNCCLQQIIPKSGLTKKMAESSDPIEGYWIYLDRSTDDRFFELGGKYTIAIIKEDAGYNVLYVDGAELYSGYWIPYMSKRPPFRNAICGAFRFRMA